MEDVLDVYHRPYDKNCPVICMDEKPYQLLDEKRDPIPMKNDNSTKKEDSEYIRNGTCSIFMFNEALVGWRKASVRERRTKKDWALEIQELLEVDYKDAPKVCLVMDNLNTHTLSSLYETFPAQKARSLAKRLEIHYTPKHGSWLNMAEIELSVMTSQCLDRRIASLETLSKELTIWYTNRNLEKVKVQWQFTTEDARIKLHKLYPTITIN